MGIPLQCELCHIRNIEKKDPNLEYERMFILTWRGNIDNIWVRYKDTVNYNLNASRMIHREFNNHHLFTKTIPSQGPFTIYHVVCMKPEVLKLHQ